MRYSHLPNEIKGLWGIRLDPDASVDDHVTWIARRSAIYSENAKATVGDAQRKLVSFPLCCGNVVIVEVHVDV